MALVSLSRVKRQYKLAEGFTGCVSFLRSPTVAGRRRISASTNTRRRDSSLALRRVQNDRRGATQTKKNTSPRRTRRARRIARTKNDRGLMGKTKAKVSREYLVPFAFPTRSRLLPSPSSFFVLFVSFVLLRVPARLPAGKLRGEKCQPPSSLEELLSRR